MSGFRSRIAVAALVLSVGLVACDDASDDTGGSINARPGTAVAIPFRQPVAGAPKKAHSIVPASAIVKPSPLPQGVTVIRESLSLHGSGDVSGTLLVLIPETAAGDLTFTLAAAGRGAGRAGSGVSFKTDAVDVRIAIAGDPPNDNPPDLAGTWTWKTQTWQFDKSAGPALRIRYSTGEEKVVRYKLYPDGQGRWFLVGIGKRDPAYWVVSNGANELAVDHPGKDFKPFATLARQ